jgi:hypothetical protein
MAAIALFDLNSGLYCLPRLGDITNTGNPSERNLFQEEFLNELLGFRGDNFLLRILHKLATTVAAFMILLAVMDATVFHYFCGLTV